MSVLFVLAMANEKTVGRGVTGKGLEGLFFALRGWNAAAE